MDALVAALASYVFDSCNGSSTFVYRVVHKSGSGPFVSSYGCDETWNFINYVWGSNIPSPHSLLIKYAEVKGMKFAFVSLEQLAGTLPSDISAQFLKLLEEGVLVLTKQPADVICKTGLEGQCLFK